MMSNLVRVISAAALAFTWAAVARAQSSSTVELVPYGGYMIYGKHIEGPLGTSIGNAGAPVLGAQLGLNLSPQIGLVGNLAYGKSNIEAGLPIIGGIKIADSEVFAYDAALQLRVPASGTVSPFVQAGVGAMSYDIEGGPISLSSTNMTWVAGVGVDADVGRNVGIRLMARDYIGKFDFKDAIGFELDSKTSHNVALSVGLRFRF